MNILYVQVPRREIGRAAAEGGGPGRRMFVSVCRVTRNASRNGAQYNHQAEAVRR